jgi:hypothetical protein
VRGRAAKLCEGCQKVRLGQDSLPNIAISAAETSRKWGCCFTRTQKFGKLTPADSNFAKYKGAIFILANVYLALSIQAI